MEQFGFAFGIFGIVAFIQSLTLASRVAALERQMARIKGTDNYNLRKDILNVAKSLIGKKVRITQKEEYLDTDILLYGNGKSGFIIITEVDDEWVAVHIEKGKTKKEKLIRIESISSISEISSCTKTS